MSEKQNSGKESTEQSGTTGEGHPAYKAILDVLPESLHSIVLPELKKWDAGVTRKFQDIHASYEDLKPYKKLAEHGIDIDYAEQAIILADQLQRDPKAVVERVNESWKLGFLPPGSTPASTQDLSGEGSEEFDFDLDDDDDLMKNPKFKAMYDALQQLQGDFQSEKQKEEEEAELTQFESYLDELENNAKSENLPFNRLFVTALMHSGIDGEDAVKQYHQVLAGGTQVDTTETSEQAPNTETSEQAPVVMGGEGTGGSGSPDGSVDFGGMNKDAINKTVEQILAQANESG